MRFATILIAVLAVCAYSQDKAQEMDQVKAQVEEKICAELQTQSPETQAQIQAAKAEVSRIKAKELEGEE